MCIRDRVKHNLFGRGNTCTPACGMVALSVGHGTCDLQVVGSSPASAPLRSGHGQATYTCVPLSPSSITWYQSKGGCLATGEYRHNRHPALASPVSAKCSGEAGNWHTTQRAHHASVEVTPLVASTPAYHVQGCHPTIVHKCGSCMTV